MNLQFQLRTGKHTGKTIEWLQKNEPYYLAWIKENAPGMIKGANAPAPKPVIRTEVKFRDKPIEAIRPNFDFDKEGPDELSKPFLNKIQGQE